MTANLPVPGTNDIYTAALISGILGPTNADYQFAGGAGITCNCDTSKWGVFRIAGTTTTSLTVALNNPGDGRVVTLYFIANSAGTMTITMPASVVYLGTPPNLVLQFSQVASMTLRYDAVMNAGAGGWVEVYRSGFGPSWIAPTLGASITNLAGWEPAGYRIDSNRIVHLKGVLTGAGLTTGAIIFTLPAGFRPGAGRMFTGMSLSGSTPSNATISVDTSGNVKVNTIAGTTAFTAMEGADFAAI